MAKPTKLTPQLQKRICARVARANFLATAAASCGVGPRTVHEWIERGERESTGMYRDFADAITEARAKAEAMLVAQLLSGVKEKWRAAAWLLERLFPKKWGADRDEARLRRELLRAKIRGEVKDAPTVIVDVKQIEDVMRDAFGHARSLAPPTETKAG
jgi:hypothetical protein